MSDSIHDQLGEASASHHLIRYEYPQKRFYTGTGSAAFNFYYAHPIQTPDQTFYGYYPASIPGRGAAKIQTAGYGLGANGVGVTFPPPKPGSVIFAAEPNRGQVIRLGELSVNGAQGEIGLDRIDQNGVQVRSQSFLPIQSTYSANGFSIVSSIPRPDLTNTPSGTPLFAEIPGNVLFHSFTNATTYEVNINATHRLYRSEPTVALGFLGNSTSAIEALANQHQTAQQYQNFLSGADGVYFVDPTQKIPTLYQTSIETNQPLTQTQLAQQKQTQAEQKARSESFTSLARQQGEFVKDTYIRLQQREIECWSEAFSNKISELTPRGLDHFLQQINEYLPTVLNVLGLDKNKVETNSYTFDPARLTLEPNFNFILSALNQYLPSRIHLRYEPETKTLFYLEHRFRPNVLISFTDSLLLDLKQLNDFLPDLLKLKFYVYQAKTTAIKIAPGIYLYEDLGLVVPDGFDLAAYSLSKLRCGLPPFLFEGLNPTLIYSADGLQIQTNLDAPNHSFLNELLSLIGASDSFDELGRNAFDRLTEFLPSELRNIFVWNPNNQLQFSPQNLFSGGAALLNKELPDWMQLGVQFNGSKLESFSVGPLNLLMKNGLTLSVDLSRANGLLGGFDLLDIINVLPESIRGVPAIAQKVIYPLDRLAQQIPNNFGLSFVLKGSAKPTAPAASKSVADYIADLTNDYLRSAAGDENQTINTGGNLPNNPQLGIQAEPKGSPYPLLKFTADLISRLNKQPVGGLGYFPGYSPVGISPLTGKKSLFIQPEICYIDSPLLTGENGKENLPLTLEIPNQIRNPVDRQIVQILTQTGLGLEAVQILRLLNELVDSTYLSFYPQTDFTGLLHLVAVASPALQLPLSAAAVTLGSDKDSLLSDLRETQTLFNPSCSDLAGISSLFDRLDGTQTQLNEFTNAVAARPLLLEKLLDSLAYLIEWVEEEEPRFSPVLHSLLLGDLYHFLIEWVYYRTGRDLYQNPQRLIELHHALASRFPLSVPGFDVVLELTYLT
ncbi:hypothetical protein ACQ4M3_18995 [Leptolyngbya sp. AN03gr2]|uniref:hypothetical protein n=1 Tax=Leptolyngbya sp. AN03gr2 TaxID=3423364 RepID=UPI003D322848